VTVKIRCDNGSALVSHAGIGEEAPQKEELAGTEEGQRIFKETSKRVCVLVTVNVIVSAELHSTMATKKGSIATTPLRLSLL
jgi:hypothetical protein